MITAEGKCDSICNTCNIIQQSHCKMVQFILEQNKLMIERLNRLDDKIIALDKRLNSEIIVAQGGSGAFVEKASNNII